LTEKSLGSLVKSGSRELNTEKFTMMFSARSHSRIRVNMRDKRAGRQERPVFSKSRENPVPAILEITKPRKPN
jgi:hypothetical protein